GSTGPIYLVAAVNGPEQVAALGDVNEHVAADPEVGSVLGPHPNAPPGPTTVRWLVTPKGGPQDESTTELVNRLRGDVLPPIEDAAGTSVLVTGLAPATVGMS